MRWAPPRERDLTPYEAGFPPGRRWLVIAPHADDETFGPGGTLALAAARGVEVTVAVLTDGSAQGEPGLRKTEAAAAARVLGLKPPSQIGFADRSLGESVPRLQRALMDLVRSGVPETVVVPAPVELHPDHRATAVALQRALRRRPGVGWVAAYEVGATLRPNLLVDVSPVWQVKEAAAACYASQLAALPYARVMDALAAFRSLTLGGVGCAEGFHVLPAGLVAGLSARAWAARMGSPVGVSGAVDFSVYRWLAFVKMCGGAHKRIRAAREG